MEDNYHLSVLATLAKQLEGALRYIHERSVVHLDVSPQKYHCGARRVVTESLLDRLW